MKRALFLNGVYEGVLEEILKAQDEEPGITCYLQPYKNQAIKMLARRRPSEHDPIPCYISLTSSLDLIGFTATIVGWEDKRELFRDQARIDRLDEHMKRYRPGEREVYRYSDDDQTRECVNLIAIRNLGRLANPFSVRNLVKVSDGKPYNPRSQSGGWSEVRAVPAWAHLDDSAFVDVLEADLEARVEQSMQDSAEARRARLAQAAKQPKEILLRSRGFARTYAGTWPHEYLVRERVDEGLFVGLVEHIRAHGYPGSFYDKELTCYDEDGLVYWTRGAPVAETTIVNRCRKEQTCAYRLAHDDLPG